MVVARDVIVDLGRILERLESLRETLRHEQHPAIVLRQLRPEPACGAEIDDHVVHRAARAAHQLGLGMRRALIVHPAHRSAMRVERDGGLHDVRKKRAELGIAVCPREESALVAQRLDLHDVDAIERRFHHLQGTTSARGIGMTNRPPHSRMCAIWLMISSRRFHASTST